MAIFLLVHLYVIIVFPLERASVNAFFLSGARGDSEFRTLPFWVRYFFVADKMVI